MPTLILVRHGQSQWNLENRFTGWWDVELTEKGVAEAAAAATVQAMADVQGATMFASNRDALLANTASNIPAGSVFATRAITATCSPSTTVARSVSSVPAR